MPILAGIDEAGYGPLLGPLVLAAVRFRVPDAATEGDLWDILRSCVSRRFERDGARPTVADSKVLLRGRKGLAPLEEGVQAFLRVSGVPCGSLQPLADALDGQSGEAWERCPWRRGRDLPLPLSADPHRVARLSGALGQGMAEAGVEFLGASAAILDAPEFNESVARFGNKATAAAARAFGLVEKLWQDSGGEPLAVHMDKLGGRNAYGNWLAAVCPGAEIRVVQEGAEASEYAVASGTRRMALRIEPRADSAVLPVALASMTAKYTRELFMAMFNAYWAERCPGLTPTAGYYADGKRFLADLAERGEAQEDTLRLMVRTR